MRTFTLNKLVRDGILPDMEANGQKAVWRKLQGDELASALSKKAQEEANELAQADADISEAADVITVARAWAAAKGVSLEELEQLIVDRNIKRGGFENAIYIETVSVPDDSPMVAYYESDPARFPEVKI